jgi:hypothetical protein
MQYTHHLVDGVTVLFTNVPGSGHTQVEVPGHPALKFDPDTRQFSVWHSTGRETIEPDFARDFKTALLDALEQHTRCRREWYRRANAGVLPSLQVHPSADGGHELERRITPALVQAYAQTHYTVHHTPAFTLRIGQPCCALDALLLQSGQDGAAFITAWNPMSQPLSDAQNRERQASLAAQLDALGRQTLPGIGQHPTGNWPGEESLLVIGLELPKACELAREHQQLAFVWHRLHKGSQLIDPISEKELTPS